jgi:hypothetical protein
VVTPFDVGTSALLAIEDHLPVPRNREARNSLFRSLDVLRALVLGYDTPAEPAAVTELIQSETD